MLILHVRVDDGWSTFAGAAVYRTRGGSHEPTEPPRYTASGGSSPNWVQRAAIGTASMVCPTTYIGKILRSRPSAVAAAHRAR